MNTNHWMADADFIGVTTGRRPWLIGEDENGHWWVPCHWRDTVRQDGWRRFHRYNPLDWLSYLNSRRRNQVVFLFG